MFCYIKNGKLEATSEELIENGQGVSYDEVIETDIEGRVDYVEGEIVAYIEPEVIQEETPEQLRQKKIGQFISAEVIEDFDWEGVEISAQDYSNLITARDFGNDQGSQVALLTKSLFKFMAIFLQMGVKKEVIKSLFSQEIEMARKVSETRVGLGLSPFDLSFLD